MNAGKNPTTLVEAVRHFSDLDVAHEFFVNVRWPDGSICCPRCGDVNVKYFAKYRRYECKSKHPLRQFSIKTGTVMEDSPMGLDKWAVAFWLEVNAKNGISSYEIHRALGITQKSAWFLLHRIRLAMQTGTFKKLSGHIEIDETFIGGLARNMHRADKARKIHGTGGMGKVAVMGLLERNGEVVTMVVPNTKRKTLEKHIDANCEKGSFVYTDGLKSYNNLANEFIHGVIDHSQKYVEGRIHVNGMENFWSLLKRT